MITYLRKANFYLCPTSLGGGLKLRIMDGLRNGIPVCTHAVSARGYDDFIGKSVFSYHDETSFKQSLISTVQCKMSANEIADDYAKSFTFNSGVERLEKILEEKYIK